MPEPALDRRRSTPRLLANLLAFEAGWLACVLGGSLSGGTMAIVILIAHLRWQAWPGEWRWLLGFILLGLAVDGGLTRAGGFDFSDAPLILDLLPAWLWLLWPLFATLLHHSLAWLWTRPWLATLCGAVGGPLSYYAGAKLANVSLAPWLLPTQALIWAGLCLWLCRRLGHHPTFRH
ncbi:DUF2878 domain-containing protein [Halomonas icarae]|uniref:DUF2878 family protein n=1 Tax=Halomonas icarae TaxID=2691040 RepID=A0A7X4W1A7_9GAMM|nr:DUF2878 domain-containing protein [Halomonas icarae]MDR5903218.1 DUF2878 domain-containing protein [Halomonas icarae]NAW14065.1 DUF2878 family protein [Halomonas icarae]